MVVSVSHSIRFTRLADGTLLERQPDDTFRPVASLTDRTKLAALTEAEIERMASCDPDHPGLDETFWATMPAPLPDRDARSIKLEPDVLRYFRKDGRDVQSHVNAVLRRFIRSKQTSA